VTHERIEFRFNAPVHLLAVYELGLHRAGETFVQGAPRSSLRGFSGKLTFELAGHEYREWQEPCVRPRVLYVFFDARELHKHSGVETTDLVPRVFFEDATLWDTAAKLARLIENSTSDDRSYIEALGVLLAQEVARLGLAKSRVQPRVRGALPVGRSESSLHISTNISPSTFRRRAGAACSLESLPFLSGFQAVFRHAAASIPPDATDRTGQGAKPSHSVTDIASDLGFSQTSSFSAAFRRATGQTPTGYYKDL